MIDTLNINFKLMSQSEITNHYNIRQFHNRDIKFKDKTTEEQVHLNTLLEEYFRENHSGTPKQKSSDKNKLKNKVCQSSNRNASSNFMHFEMWCEKERFRVMYENSIDDNMKYEVARLNETICDLRKKLKKYEKNIIVEEIFENTSPQEVNAENPPQKKETQEIIEPPVNENTSPQEVNAENPPQKKENIEIIETPLIQNTSPQEVNTNTSPQEVNAKNPPKNYEYKRIDWIDLLDHCETIDERERIFIDTLRSIGDEVFENYKDSIQSSFDICPILEKHYDYLIESWKECPEKYDIDDKIIENLYEIVNSSFDALISSED